MNSFLSELPRSDEAAGKLKPWRQDCAQAAGDGLQADDTVMCRASALEDVDLQLPVHAEGGHDPKRRCRGLVLSGGRPEQEHQPRACVGAHLEPANLLRARLGQPGDEGSTGTGLHQLFDCPQPLGGRVDLNPDEVLFVDPGVQQARQVWRLWWPDHDHGAAAGHDTAQRWPDESPFEDGRLGAQDLGDALSWPATTGQLRIQRRETARHDGAGLLAQVAPSPDGLLDFRRQLTRLRTPGARLRWTSKRLGRELIVFAGP